MSRFLANEIEKIEQMVYPRVVISGVANAMWEATFGTNKVEGMLNSNGAGEAYLPKIGTWTFKMKSGSGERTTTAVIESANDTVNISLAYAVLTITGDVGNTIMAVNGDYSISGVVGAGGTVQFSIGNGTWVLTSSDETLEASDNVVIGDGDSNVSKTLTLPTITVTTAGRASISAVKDGVTVSGTADSNGECVLKVSVGTWEVSATSVGETKTGHVVVNAPSTNSYVDLRFVSVHIYGAQWDGSSSTAWTRTDDAARFGACNPYVSGASSYSSPFDELMPWSGMTVSERTGGSMVAIPKFWYKLTQDGDSIKVQIADSEVEGFNVSPSHMDRGDGKGERDVVYVGRYHCASDYKSKTGAAPVGNITRKAARTSIHNLGSNIWQMDFAMRFTLWLLYIVEFANWDSQTKIGYGCGNNSSAGNMGYTDSMPYHTGTTQSARTTYGLGTQYRNIEGLWDNVYDWCDGAYNNSSGLNIILNPANFSDSSNGTSVGKPTSGYPSAFSVKNVNGTYPLFIPSASSGSGSTYSADDWNFNASFPCLCVGGFYSQDLNRGLFFVSRYGTSSASANVGARLMELP